ncbi:MAG: PilW family protein [Cellvibrionaceae bacterium]|nr:PilW family protein [Cellvibrionaceae bacterium]
MEIRSNKQRSTNGFSIVELMVAILIGLIILAGVIQVVITSKTTFLGQEEMSFIQENARYAMDVIGKDIQGAGYKGCAGQDARVALVAGGDAKALEFLGLESLRGYLNENGAPNAYSGDLNNVAGGVKSESILIRSFRGPHHLLTSHSGQTLNFSAPHGFSQHDYLGVVAEDCRRVGVVRISERTNTSVSYASANNHGMSTIKPSLDKSIICPGAECATGYSQNYNPGSVAMNFLAHAYYIGDSSALPGSPALKRAVLTNRAGNGTVVSEELALGVEDIHFRYGIKNGGDTSYVLANAVTDWSQVFAVEVSLMMRSQTPSLSVAESKTLGSSGRTYTDKHMRQVVTSIYRIRNRI